MELMILSWSIPCLWSIEIRTTKVHEPTRSSDDDSLRLYLYQIEIAHALLPVCIQERRTTFCASEGRDLPMNHHPINRDSRQRILRLLWTKCRSPNGSGMLTIHTHTCNGHSTWARICSHSCPSIISLVSPGVWDTKTRTNIWNAGEGKEFGFK